MKIPVTVKVLALMVVSTLFYTYVGQLVPQKEVHPPEVIEMADDLTTEDLVGIGKGIFNGKGICITCHNGGERFPDLVGIATIASTRIPGISADDYLAQSLYKPNEFIVEGFNPGMPDISKPPIGLTDDEIRAVIAYLQTRGGTATITMDTVVAYSADAPDGVVAGAEPASTDGADAGVAVAATAAPTGPLGRFGCTSCHYTDQPGRLQAASLVDVGDRLSEAEILTWLTDHQPPLGGAYANEATLADVRALLATLTSLRGQG